MSGGKYPSKTLRVLAILNGINYGFYSSLMGLLATNGASLQQGYMWHWDHNSISLRLSHTNTDFLGWLVDLFTGLGLSFKDKEFIEVLSSRSIKIGSLPSQLCFILWLHWNESTINELPYHFAEYFSIKTLAFWAMRNGHWVGNTFIIVVGSRQNDFEKTLLMTLIKDKLGFDSHLIRDGKQLAIHNPEDLVFEMKPYFHSSQMHRLQNNLYH